jgi:hypothetical protein
MLKEGMSKQCFLRLAVGITVFYILFLALFALDAFVPGETLIHNLTGFLIHLIPNFILALLLLFSWRYHRPGSLLFLSIFFLALYFFRGNNPIVQLILFSPLLLISGLFYLADKKTVK